MDEDQQIQEHDSQKVNSAVEVAKDKTREYIRGLWQVVSRYSRVERFIDTEPNERNIPERFRFENRGLLAGLAVIPYLLLGIFTLSLFWDLPGYRFELFGQVLQFEGLLKILSVSGLIGFFTNWIAITMLFKPSQKRPILGYGLIPAQKDRIAFRLAQAVADDLINPEIIKQKIHESQVIARYREQATDYIKTIIDDPEFRDEIKNLLVHYVDEMIADPEIRAAVAEKILMQIEESIEDQSIEKVALKAYSFIKGQQMQQIIEDALIRIPGSVESGLDRFDDLLDTLPEKIDEHSDVIENVVTTLLYKLVNQLDVQALVEDNLRAYDEQRLTDIIRGATNEQLRYIQYLGAILGTIGGLVIWEPIISLITLGLLFGIVLSVDQLLLQVRKS